MAIKIVRIDERLVHGQVAYSWSTAYQIDEILVIDDQAAYDNMQRMLLEMAVPEAKRFKLMTVDKAFEYLSRDSSTKIFIVVKSPKSLLTLIKKGIKINSINIGGMYFKKGKKEINKTVFVNEEETEMFKQLGKMGVNLDVRTAPNDKSINLLDKI